MLKSAMNSSAQGAAEQSWRILYADDVRELRVLVENILSRDGHVVKCVENGVEAWTVLSTTEVPYDAVITDHNMPGMSGLELVRKLRATGFAGKIIVVSSDLSEAVDHAYQDLKVDRVFKKPFPLTRLQTLVAELQRSMG
jgi:CheY-like chemotaxis protein